MNIHGKQPNRAARILLSTLLYHGYRIFIAGLFLYAGTIKLADTAGLAQTIAAYRILPDPLVPCAAMGLPAAEILVAIGALANRRWAILGLLGMIILFLGVLSYGVAMGLNIDCGCFETKIKAEAKPAESGHVLNIPGVDDGGAGGIIVPIEPVPDSDASDETCSEENAGSSSLKIALIRDFLLFLGILYLVAWPDLRRRYGLTPSSK